MEGIREVYVYHSMSVRRSGKTVLRRYEKVVMARTRMARGSIIVMIGDGKGMSGFRNTGYGPN